MRATVKKCNYKNVSNYNICNDIFIRLSSKQRINGIMQFSNNNPQK